MRIFVAGASGVIGVRLVQLLAADGHEIAAMTRSPERADTLRALGAEPVVCDVYEKNTLIAAVVAFAPDAVVHQLTDLPDDAREIRTLGPANARMRREGTDNLLAAAHAAEASRVLAQSVAWRLDGEPGAAVRHLERATLDAGGVVLRYGRFYGPGTYHEHEPPPPPRVQIDEAARRTVVALDAPSGVLEIVDAR